jgi:hypothetical protein
MEPQRRANGSKDQPHGEEVDRGFIGRYVMFGFLIVLAILAYWYCCWVERSMRF